MPRRQKQNQRRIQARRDVDAITKPPHLRVNHRGPDRGVFDFNDSSSWSLFAHTDLLSMQAHWNGFVVVLPYRLTLRQSRLGVTDRVTSFCRHLVRCATMTSRLAGRTAFTLNGNRTARRRCPMIVKRVQALWTCFDYVHHQHYTAEGGDCLTAAELALFPRGPRTQTDWVKHALRDRHQFSRGATMVAAPRRLMESLRLDGQSGDTGWLPPYVAGVDGNLVPNPQEDLILCHLVRTHVDAARWPADLHHTVLQLVASVRKVHVLCSG